MRFSHLIISVPLLLSATQLLPKLALAEGLDPAEATTLLAKSHAINLKCNVLNDSDGQQLRDFVARAEISLAEKASVSTARKAISSGRTAAQTAACDDANRKMVGDVLAAAKTAVERPVVADNKTEAAKSTVPETTALAVVEPEPTPLKVVAKPQKPISSPKQIVIIKPPKATARLKTVPAAKPVKPVKSISNLSGYAQVAENYYAALKCGTMSRNRMAKLYQNVLASHQQAVATHSPRDVKAMLRNAEARAGGRSCT
jgi:outer membrane biosynthesis protein TonB